MEQRSPEWFAVKAGKFSGSRFAALMAKTRTGPSASRANLIAQLAVERINGTCEQGYQSAAMLRGTDLEPEALRAYEETRLCVVEPVAWMPHPAHSFVGCSPDGLVGSEGMVEVKCPEAYAKHLAAIRDGAHAQEYAWQLQGQLWVADRAWVDAVSYDPRWPEWLRLVVVRVERDEAAISELEAACIEAEAEVCAIVDDLLRMAA